MLFLCSEALGRVMLQVTQKPMGFPELRKASFAHGSVLGILRRGATDSMASILWAASCCADAKAAGQCSQRNVQASEDPPSLFRA